MDRIKGLKSSYIHSRMLAISWMVSRRRRLQDKPVLEQWLNSRGQMKVSVMALRENLIRCSIREHGSNSHQEERSPLGLWQNEPILSNLSLCLQHFFLGNISSSSSIATASCLWSLVIYTLPTCDLTNVFCNGATWSPNSYARYWSPCRKRTKCLLFHLICVNIFREQWTCIPRSPCTSKLLSSLLRSICPAKVHLI